MLYCRYSLVQCITDDEIDHPTKTDQSDAQPKVITRVTAEISISKTYESQLDLVLEDLSDSETTTVASDSESVISVRTSRHTVTKEPSSGKDTLAVKLENYQRVNGSTNYTGPTPSKNKHKEGNTRSYHSLPRNMKHLVNDPKMEQVMKILGNTGSWPRKLSRNDLKTEQDPTKNHTNHKRRSLSPGSHKLTQNAKIHHLIEEARRMSSLGDDSSRRMSVPDSVVFNATTPQISPYASSPVGEPFRRQPSYRIACGDRVTPRKVLQRSQSEEVTEPCHQENSPSDLPPSRFVRAPSYKMAQSKSFDRGLRAPSYRKANLTSIPDTVDSHLTDVTSGGSSMTSSYDSGVHEPLPSRLSSYRLATDDHMTSDVLHHSIVRECMKGVYENEERHLKSSYKLIKEAELIPISTASK